MYKSTEAKKKRLVAWALCRREHSVSVVFGALLEKRPEVIE